MPVKVCGIKLLGTDLDTNVVQYASEGACSIDRIGGLDPPIKKKWFKNDSSGKNASVASEFKK